MGRFSSRSKASIMNCMAAVSFSAAFSAPGSASACGGTSTGRPDGLRPCGNVYSTSAMGNAAK